MPSAREVAPEANIMLVRRALAGPILFARTSPASQARLFVDVSQYVAQTPVAPLFVRS